MAREILDTYHAADDSMHFTVEHDAGEFVVYGYSLAGEGSAKLASGYMSRESAATKALALTRQYNESNSPCSSCGHAPHTQVCLSPQLNGLVCGCV